MTIRVDPENDESRAVETHKAMGALLDIARTRAKMATLLALPKLEN